MKPFDTEIEKLLTSLDEIQPAPLPEGFEERLYQKVRFLPGSSGNTWLKLGVAAMIIMMLTNIVTLIQLNREGARATQIEWMRDDLIADTSMEILDSLEK